MAVCSYVHLNSCTVSWANNSTIWAVCLWLWEDIVLLERVFWPWTYPLSLQNAHLGLETVPKCPFVDVLAHSPSGPINYYPLCLSIMSIMSIKCLRWIVLIVACPLQYIWTASRYNGHTIYQKERELGISLLYVDGSSDPLSYFAFQPVLHDWCNKDRGMCYPICEVVHLKDPLLPNGKSSKCSGGNGFPLSLSEWSFMMSYNRK